jgi:hypothetical protein
LNLFEEDRRLTIISAKSVDDALAFAAATILTTQDEIRADLLARCLIVQDPAALRRFDSSGDLLLLLPYREEVLRDAEQATSHVILLCEDSTPADLKLPPIDIDQVESLLQAEGVQPTFARRLARAAGTSIRSFQRVASQRPPIGSEWRSVLSDASLRRAWLLGSWTTSRSGDLEVFGLVVGQSFEEVEEELRTAVRESDRFSQTSDQCGQSSAQKSKLNLANSS